ncbi:hypothetical protein BAUCODRAFT_36093 [Baudoinia panamericana UAMH 10762]|uniref:Uncharacterized protein n=1 Tax=Baudoinia panamericana (strain UAMH 10762) TaxID=717646 RepID=M2LKM3_BAUPA|nr:uncharacterized protein BAUCODRAFT_36093 [Baudoinia panamericana UAMH 10762]EMC94832.1 hypothetical protein BAUCODRAFT_36093 [Baudoinia panamericana UAMH 10762]
MRTRDPFDFARCTSSYGTVTGISLLPIRILPFSTVLRLCTAKNAPNVGDNYIAVEAI